MCAIKHSSNYCTAFDWWEPHPTTGVCLATGPAARCTAVLSYIQYFAPCQKQDCNVSDSDCKPTYYPIPPTSVKFQIGINLRIEQVLSATLQNKTHLSDAGIALLACDVRHMISSARKIFRAWTYSAKKHDETWPACASDWSASHSFLREVEADA